MLEVYDLSEQERMELWRALVAGGGPPTEAEMECVLRWVNYIRCAFQILEMALAGEVSLHWSEDANDVIAGLR